MPTKLEGTLVPDPLASSEHAAKPMTATKASSTAKPKENALLVFIKLL